MAPVPSASLPTGPRGTRPSLEAVEALAALRHAAAESWASAAPTEPGSLGEEVDGSHEDVVGGQNSYGEVDDAAMDAVARLI